MGCIYRVYTSNDSFQRLQKLSAVSSELHVVLAFARDYDDDGTFMNGTFKEYFDDNNSNNNVTPTKIAKFKQTSSSTVNFFLSIGDHTQKYPFFMADKWRWIGNATMSLQRIIQQYGFDGIDVCYPKIEANADDFVDAIGTVIDNLMKQRIISVASIAPSPSVNNSHYVPLYNKYHHNFDYVVYQTHDEPNNNDAEGVVDMFKKLASIYPKHKLLAGHDNILPDDWVTVPNPVVLRDGALARLHQDGVIGGASAWALTN